MSLKDAYELYYDPEAALKVKLSTALEIQKKAQQQAWTLKDYGENMLLKTFQKEALRKMETEPTRFVISADPNMQFVVRNDDTPWITIGRPGLSHMQRMLLLTKNSLS